MRRTSIGLAPSNSRCVPALSFTRAACELCCSQIDALLPNVRPKYHLSQPLDAFLLSLHKLLMELPSIPPQHPLHASRSLSKQNVAVPYIRPLPTEDTNWKVAFDAPTDIVLAGSWATKTAVKAKDSVRYQIDVAVAMPPVRTSKLNLVTPSNLVWCGVHRVSSRRRTTSMDVSSRNAHTTSPSLLQL